MITIITKVVNWLAGNLKLVAVSIIFLLVATIFVQRRSIVKKNEQIERITANMRAYEDMLDTSTANSRVLQLTVRELEDSRDSLLRQANKLQKELKIKSKNLTQVQVINTEAKDSAQVVIKPVQVDFSEIIKINDLTTVTVSRKDSILSAKLHILNQQILFVEERKEYKNKYKNGWIRFWHFDWRRIRIRKYQIENTNPIITVTNTRIVEVK